MFEWLRKLLQPTRPHDPEGRDRNLPCRCGSGRKYKRCCFEKDEQVIRDAWYSANYTADNQSEPPVGRADVANRALRRANRRKIKKGSIFKP
jgi:hypothetical protein